MYVLFSGISITFFLNTFQQLWTSGSFYSRETGWITGPHGEHLLWLPQLAREAGVMWLPEQLHVIGPPELRIEGQTSVHGTEWTQCYIGDRKKGKWENKA